MASFQTDKEANSTIGENSVFEGRFSVQGSLRIDGKFEGEALFVDQLLIGPKGRVKTNIEATNIVVEGMVIGNISARNRVLLLPTSRILGDIRTPELIIQNGVILEGRCTISNENEYNARALIESLYNSG